LQKIKIYEMFTETSKAERIEFDFMPFSLRIKTKKIKKKNFRPFITSFLPLLFCIFYQSWCNIWGFLYVEGLKKWTAAISLMCEGLVWMLSLPFIYSFASCNKLTIVLTIADLLNTCRISLWDFFIVTITINHP